jgi:hypothetical protein
MIRTGVFRRKRAAISDDVYPREHQDENDNGQHHGQDIEREESVQRSSQHVVGIIVNTVAEHSEPQSRPRMEPRRASRRDRMNKGTPSTRVTQSLPYQVAFIHSTSRYCSWNSRPSTDCKIISTTSNPERRNGACILCWFTRIYSFYCQLIRIPGEFFPRRIMPVSQNWKVIRDVAIQRSL